VDNRTYTDEKHVFFKYPNTQIPKHPKKSEIPGSNDDSRFNAETRRWKEKIKGELKNSGIEKSFYLVPQFLSSFFNFSLRLRVSAVKTQLEFSHGYLKLVANRSSSFYAPSIMDTNYWGLWCVPVGLLLFLPALIAAVKAKPEDPTKHSKLPPPK